MAVFQRMRETGQKSIEKTAEAVAKWIY